MDGDALLVEPEEDGLRLDTGDTQAGDVRKPAGRIAVDRHPVEIKGQVEHSFRLGAGPRPFLVEPGTSQ